MPLRIEVSKKSFDYSKIYAIFVEEDPIYTIKFYYIFSEKLRSLQSDYEDLETENERLTTLHSQLSMDSEKKERFWKERLENLTLPQNS